jgi:ferritin
MSIKEKTLSALNKQINEEMFSSYLYLSMAAYFETLTLKGFAHWMRIQAREENSHALKIFDYINEAGGAVQLTALAAPKTKWENTIQVFEETVAHEKHITACINSLYETAMAEKDLATANMLQWFIAEQVEEEANPTEILNKITMIKGSMSGLLYLDKELKKRE